MGLVVEEDELGMSELLVERETVRRRSNPGNRLNFSDD